MVSAPLLRGQGRARQNVSNTIKFVSGGLVFEGSYVGRAAITVIQQTASSKYPHINPLPYEAVRARYSVKGSISSFRDDAQKWLFRVSGTYHPYNDGPFTTIGNDDGIGTFRGLANPDIAADRAALNCQVNAAGIQYELANEAIQMRSTVDMIAGRTLQVLRCFRSLQKGDFNKAYRHLFGGNPKSRFSKKKGDTKESLWLEWQYGWRPLLGDIYQGVQDIQQGIDKPITKVVGSGKSDIKMSYLTLPIPRFIATGPVSCSNYQTTARATVLLRTSPLQQTWTRRLGLDNPALILWQAIPYSFVVDWFLPVGQLLESFQGAWALSGNLMSISSRLKLNASQSGYSASSLSYPANRMSQVVGSLNFGLEVSYIKRSVRAASSFANLHFEFPLRSPERVLSAVALISTSKRFR